MGAGLYVSMMVFHRKAQGNQCRGVSPKGQKKSRCRGVSPGKLSRPHHSLLWINRFCQRLFHKPKIGTGGNEGFEGERISTPLAVE